MRERTFIMTIIDIDQEYDGHSEEQLQLKIEEMLNRWAQHGRVEVELVEGEPSDS